MTTDQLEFARKHGIKRCPPGPTFRVIWHARFDTRVTEDERISHYSGVEVPPDWLEAARTFYEGRTGNRVKRHQHRHGQK